MGTAPSQASSAAPAAEEVVYDSTVEGLFKRALGARFSLRSKQRLKDAGLDLDGKLQSRYPRLKYYEFVRIAAEELYPSRSLEEAHYELGRAFIDGFQLTVIGKTVSGMARLLGPKRTLARMSQNMESSNNYLRTSHKELGPGKVEISLSQVSGAPGYFRGVLQRIMEIVNAVNPRVRTIAAAGQGAVYLVEWDEKP